MASPESHSLSAKYGIPAAIILGHRRYSYCDASEATLESVSEDGKTAIYQGVCACRHIYREKISIAELKRKTRVVIENGKYVYKHIDKVKLPDNQLEDF